MALINGTSDNDTLVGGVLKDTLNGLKGDDLLQGLGENDRLIGEDGEDTLEGGSGNDLLYGGDDDDLLMGGAGNDTLAGEDDDDTLKGGDGADFLYGGDDDDLLMGGAGADTLNGGSDRDTASYEGSTSGVTVNLLTGQAKGGDAEGDRLIEIENLIGSVHGDTLVGDSGDNVFEGGGGVDIIQGGLGSDTASYEHSDLGIQINLSTGVARGGDAAGDQLSEIENLRGSAHNDTLVGSLGDNVFEGGGGADVIQGGLGSDTASYEHSELGVQVNLSTGSARGGDAEGDQLSGIENLMGSDQDDTLVGDDSANDLNGGEGEDLLIGGAGADTLHGGDDVDTASYESSSKGVTVDLSTGLGSGGDAEGDQLSEIENLIGSGQDDWLMGDDGDNLLQGGGGNDSLQGNGGDDILEGGDDADALNGGDGADTASYQQSAAGVKVSLLAGIGQGGAAEGDTLVNIENLLGSNHSDILIGDRNDNQLDGGNGADKLQGKQGDDTLNGGSGDDTLLGGNGADTLEGGLGGDTIKGGRGRDTASYQESTEGVRVNLATGIGQGGDAEGDRLTHVENLLGSDEADELIGDLRANILDGGGGGDLLDGGAGKDTVTYENSEDEVTVDLSTGVGRGGDAEGDRLTHIENLIGSTEEDTLIGDGAANVLVGGDEDDDLQGNAGNDVLDGGNDKDVLDGGAGEDSLLGGNGNDTLIGGADGDRLDGGGGVDTASYKGSSAIMIDLAKGIYSGGDADGDQLIGIENLRGSDYQDTLIGDGGNNVLEGGKGGDLLSGGVGRDTASYTESETGVAIDLATGHTSGGDANGDRLVDIENLRGSTQDDLLKGDGGDNILWGLEGADTLQGGHGEDILYGDDGNDTLFGGHGDDVLQGNGDSDFLSGGAGNDALFGGASDDVLEGGEGRDFLSGEAGADRLRGGAGNDTLIGGGDADQLFGDAGADILRGGAENDRLAGGQNNDQLEGGTGDDWLDGGGGNDILDGGLGVERLTGGDGADTFKFKQRQDSTLDNGFDHITDLEIGIDVIDGPKAVPVAQVVQLDAVASLDQAGIGAVLTRTVFSAGRAATFSYGNRTFLAFNDEVAGFSASRDGLVEITGFKGDLAQLAIADSDLALNDQPINSSLPVVNPQTLANSPHDNTRSPMQGPARRIFIRSSDDIAAAIAQAQFGDTLVLENGVYQNLNIHLNKPGVAFRAETAGQVTITGDSDIRIEADHVTVSGFKFDQITRVMPVVRFDGARYSRLTQNAFYDCGDGVKDHIVELRSSSRYNRVDHNLMEGNRSIGIAVLGTRKINSYRENIEHLDNWYNRIERNYIKDVPYPGGDVNGREGIQLGQLKNDEDARITGRSIVEYNLLENVDYDPEVISIKTNENIVRFNTIRGSENGGLVVRAGDDNVIAGNFIFDAKEGIRINGANTQVINNYIEGAKRGIRFRYQPTNATVANNTLVNTTNVGVTADVDSGFPWSAKLYNNIVQSDQGSLIDSSLNLGDVAWANNIVWAEGTAQVGTLSSIGAAQTNPDLSKSDEIYRLDPDSPAINGGISVKGTAYDIDGQIRRGLVDIGADEFSQQPANNGPLSSADVGAFWTLGEAGKHLSANGQDSMTLYGGDRNDVLDASNGIGHHRLNGRAGNDEMIVGNYDWAYGGDGNDLLEAQFGRGHNHLHGGQGHDEIVVGRHDQAYGGQGDDFLNGRLGGGDNLLNGGSGNDDFHLGRGDRAVGGSGRDRFFVYASGHNTLTGGTGADEFWLANGQLPDSPNQITDFHLGVDILGISGLGLSFSDLRLIQIGKDTHVAADNGQLAILQGIRANRLSAANFTFN